MNAPTAHSGAIPDCGFGTGGAAGNTKVPFEGGERSRYITPPFLSTMKLEKRN